MAVYLAEHGYTPQQSDRIVDLFGDGASLEGLLVDGTIDPEDGPGAREALAEGQSVPWSKVRPPELAGDDGEGLDDYPETDLDALPDPTPDQAVTRAPGYREALERDGITLIPDEGFEPSDEDLVEWGRYLHGLSLVEIVEAEKIQAMREWYARNNFADWHADGDRSRNP
jgi:hypothetical protein